MRACVRTIVYKIQMSMFVSIVKLNVKYHIVVGGGRTPQLPTVRDYAVEEERDGQRSPKVIPAR